MSHKQKLIHHFLEESAAVLPDKIALIHENIRLSYREINNQANHIAQYFLEKGLNRGDRIAILLENSLEYVVSYYGTLKAGGVVVPLNSDLKLKALETILCEIEPKAIISSTKFEKLLQTSNLGEFKVQDVILKAPKMKWVSTSFRVIKLEELMEGFFSSNPGIQMVDTEVSSIIYTSGSTGRPKGAMLSHRNIVSNTLSICQYLHLSQRDIQMVVLPFFYVMGKSLLNTHFAVGGSVVINNKFAFPAAVLNEMVAEQVTGFSGVPSTYAHLLHRSPLSSYCEKLVSLRYCSQAGGHMAKVVKEGLRKVLPAHTQIYIMYGATEAGARLSYLPPEQFEEKMDSIGKAIPGVTLRILGPSGEEMPPGEIGELVAAGENIMLGYWRDPEGSEKVLCSGWYHTGDQAYQDEDGFFYVIGRKDDLLKVGGHRINPREIEDVLMESGMVVEAAIIGVQDDLLGNRLIAFVAPRNGECNEKGILKYCFERLPKFKIPEQIKIVRELPKNANGKIRRSDCLQLLHKR